MAKTINRLSVKKVDNLKTPGWYPDGNGLYLQVSKSGSKSWVYRYQVDGKQKWHGLGSYTKVAGNVIYSAYRRVMIINNDKLH